MTRKCLLLGLALMACCGGAFAAPLPRYGAFVFSDVCTEEESSDAAGYRLILVRLPYEDHVIFEWSEGPLVAGVGDHVTIDPAGHLSFHVAPDDDPRSMRIVQGVLSAEGFSLAAPPDAAAASLRLPRVDFSATVPYCVPGNLP